MSSYLSWFGYGSQSGEKQGQQKGKDGENEDSKDEVKAQPSMSKDVDHGESSVEQSNQNAVEKKDEDTASKTNTTKVVAKNVSSFLYGFASAASNRLKECVDETFEKGIIGDFKRENEKFIREKHSKSKDGAVPPWIGFHEEDVMKEQILALSTDERNFLRDPPDGVEFYFSLDSFMPVAIATLKEDPNLKDMRFKLVPRKISEFCFWRNYFYRVSLIKQSSQLLSLSRSDSKKQSSSSLDKLEAAEKAADDPEVFDIKGKSKDGDEVPENSPTSQEFVSDCFEHNSHEALSKEEMKQMGVDTEKEGHKANSGEAVDEWEKELQDELNDFEFVSEDPAAIEDTDPNWEKEIEDMLELEETQEKTEK